MASPDIAGGNVGGLLAFMDFMIDKGYASAGAITPWKSAARQVFSTVEGEDFESLDVRGLDIDDYIERFQNRTIGKYSAESLQAYRQRFRKAVESYCAYLADPNWRPSLKRVPRPKKGDKNSSKRSKANTAGPRAQSVTSPATPAPGASLITYPFPLKNGQMAQLHLPSQGLDSGDADRLTHFLRALVFEQPPQLGPGATEEDK